MHAKVQSSSLITIMHWLFHLRQASKLAIVIVIYFPPRDKKYLAFPSISPCLLN